MIKDFSKESTGDIEGGVLVIDCLNVFFPQLADHLRQCESLILPLEQRALMANLGSMALNIFLRDITYTMLKDNEKLSTIVNLSCRTITLSEIIKSVEKSKNNIEIHKDSHEIILKTLVELMESETRIPTTRKENAATGRVSSIDCSFRLMRKKLYTVDILHNTTAGKAYGPRSGSQGKCSKDFPTSNIFSAGILTMLCVCKQRILKS
jgi:hypothetical protein